MKFSGWIPTATGNLSFSVIGLGSFPSRGIRTEFSDGFVVLQKRDLLDVLVPYADDFSVVSYFREKLANWALRITGQFSYLMLANTSDEQDDQCSGRILVLANALQKKKIKELKTYLRTADPTSSLSKLEALLGEHCCYTANFRLERQGRLTIDVEQQGDGQAEIDIFLANQAFYFLKDIAHVHQHHDPKHDAITGVTQIDEDENAWKSGTHYSLFRSIIRYKRFRNEKALFRASGVLAYTKAFHNNYLQTDASGRKFSYDELEQSLQVSRSELQHFDQKRIARIETFRNFFFALFGLAISVSYLSRLAKAPDVDVDDRIIRFAAILAQHPIEAVGITLLASAAWMVLTHQLDPANNEIVRWVTRLLHSFRLRYYFLSNVALTIVFSAICYLLLRPA